MTYQLIVRGVSDEVKRRLVAIGRANGESLNVTIRKILEQAVGADHRRKTLLQYATWTSEDFANFTHALHAQRGIDAELWR